MTALVKLYNLDPAALVAWICKTYGIGNAQSYANPHRLRRETIAQRVRLYRDDGRVDFERLIDLVFETDKVRWQRRKMIDIAIEMNVSRRITDEVASLYDRPAVRTLPAYDTEYRAACGELELDEVMQEGQRLTFLCNETLLWRCAPIEPGMPPRLHVVTPDVFDAIPHPSDRLEVAGYLLDMEPMTAYAGDLKTRLPHWEVWDDTFRYLISGDGQLVDDNGNVTQMPIEHNQGAIPGVLMHRRKPIDRILDARHGRDITSAHLGVGLLEVMIMRLAKSQGERQPILKGNLANIAAGQSADGETPLVLPPEVVAEILDTKTDPDHYLASKKDKITSVALTYGMSYDQFMLQEGGDAASGKVYQMRREKLTELRNEQRRRAMLHERQVCRLLGFDATGLRIDYQEMALPQDAAEELALLRDKMKLGLDSPIAYLQRKDPDLERPEAVRKLLSNLRDYAALIMAVRALNMPAGADASNPGQTPQQNGAQGGQRALPPAPGDELGATDAPDNTNDEAA